MIFDVLGLSKLIPKGPSISLYKLSLPSHEFLLNLERRMSPSLTSLVDTFFLEHESIHGHVSSTHSGDVYGRVFLSKELLFFLSKEFGKRPLATPGPQGTPGDTQVKDIFIAML